MARYDEIALRGRMLEGEIKGWLEKGQLPEELERLMRESESWYGSYRVGVHELADAGILDAVQAESLIAQTSNRVADIRNLRDMSRLGVRETGQATVAYRGEVRNIDAFLGRLLRQKTIVSYEAVGRQGIYRVVDPQGRVSLYYPEGPAPESSRGMDLNAEALAQSFPAVPADVRMNAASVLAALGPSEATNVALQLSGPSGESVLRWLAEHGSGGTAPRFLSGDLILYSAAQPKVLEMLRAERVADLNAWSQTAFEKIVGGRSPENFLDFLSMVRERRGSIKVGGISEAQAIAIDIAGTAEVARVLPPYEGPTMSVPGEESKPHQRTPEDWVQEQQRRGYGGDFLTATIDGRQWILQARDGTVSRAWAWADGDVTGEVDVTGKLKVLRDGIAAADKLTDSAQRAAMQEALAPTADQLAFLRRIRSGMTYRDLNIAEPIQLLERVRPQKRTILPDNLPAPETTPAPAPELVPVTTRDLLIARRLGLLERATSQGLEDPLVEAVRNWNPRKGEHAPSNPGATLDLLQKHLDAAREAAIRQYKRRFGAAEIDRLKREAFGGREDFGDFLAAASSKWGITLEGLRGLGYMTQPPPEGEPPIRIDKMLDMARTPHERQVVLEQFAKIMESRPGGIPGAYRLIADMTSSRTSWRGGAWTLESLARNTHVKLSDVMAFEQTETTTIEVSGSESDVVRRYDVVLKSGEKLELKSWTRWFPESIRSQFRRDVILQTNSFTNIDGLSNVRWLFQGTPGVTEMTPEGPRFRVMSEGTARSEIQKQMELGLEEAMADLNLPADQRITIRARFRNVARGLILIDAAVR